MDRHRCTPAYATFLFAALFAAAPLHAAPAPDAPSSDDFANPVADGSLDSIAVPHAPAPILIRGTIRDANGGPVRGAVVRLMSETDTIRVQSDGSGHFRGRLTATRGVRVLVQAYGYRDLVRSFRASRSVIQAALALPPPYPLGWVTVTMADEAIRHPEQFSL